MSPLLVLILACTPTPAPPPGECAISKDCAIGELCDAATHACVQGCVTHEDCFAGEACVDHACQAYACRSTALDCAIGQSCNPATGQCEDGAGCESCSGANSCGSGQCVDFDPEQPGGDHCLMPCASAYDPEACPRGLECRDLSGLGDLFCYADCPAFQSELSDP